MPFDWNDGYATDTEWDNADARERGAEDTDCAWVLTNRDVWHANPYYTGPPMPHPEDEDAWDMVEDGTWEDYLDDQEALRKAEDAARVPGEDTDGEDIPF